jgi:hypothetical protein
MIANSYSRLQRILELLQPAFLGGFTLKDWIILLGKNHWQVDAEFIPRALVATAGTAFTSFFKTFEDRIRLDNIQEEQWQRPVFILGLGRSGTTHLFNLLSGDRQFCFPTKFDCHNPHAFLTLRKFGLLRLLGRLPVAKRHMDNVETGWLSPSEDQLAICILISSGNRIQRMFPRTYVPPVGDGNSLSDTGSDHPNFYAAITSFSRKLVFLHGRRPLFKSPAHTVAIPQIREVFPDAKFVTIFREPFSQFASSIGMRRSKASEWSALQRPAEISDELRLELISSKLSRYLETRNLIPPGNLVEIRYRDLVSDQAGTLEKIYTGLHLDMPAHFRVASRSNYQSNRHPDLPPELKNRIREIYKPFVTAGLFDPGELS